MPGPAPKRSFSREQVRRMLRVSERRLRSWERLSLVPAAAEFGFSDLIALKTLAKLRQSRVSPQRIRRAIAALKDKLDDVENPLTELKIFSDGRRLGVEIDGQKMEPITGQLLLDFDQDDLNRLLAFPAEDLSRREQRERELEAERWFQKGLELEQAGASAEEAIAVYSKATELDPKAAGAHVNLGTIYFNARAWNDAERHYRLALEADPNYALAHFNLANLCDERGDRARALFHYQAALRVAPRYADAHYNLALLYQVGGQLMKAVRHWKEYLKLDPGSSWAIIARRELEKLLRASLIEGAGSKGALH